MGKVIEFPTLDLWERKVVSAVCDLLCCVSIDALCTVCGRISGEGIASEGLNDGAYSLYDSVCAFSVADL